MTLRVRPHAPGPDGSVLEITPQSAGWSHVGFQVVKLQPGQVHDGGSADREACLVLLTGIASIEAGELSVERAGGRNSVFEDEPPAAAYVPAGTNYRVTAATPVELAIGTAPASEGGQPRMIDPARMSREVRGQGTNQRFVRNILPETEPAESLLVVEVITPGGHWSSYPPHKHDTATEGEETALEETYYHRIDPPQGFAVQRVYTDDRSIDETVSVEDGDVVMVPRGYHPVGAPHGYDVYYLNVMAGPRRNWIFRNDPAHDWIVRK
jgi:5-deoxy-glucuronate isomerase